MKLALVLSPANSCFILQITYGTSVAYLCFLLDPVIHPREKGISPISSSRNIQHEPAAVYGSISPSLISITCQKDDIIYKHRSYLINRLADIMP